MKVQKDTERPSKRNITWYNPPFDLTVKINIKSRVINGCRIVDGGGGTMKDGYRRCFLRYPGDKQGGKQFLRTVDESFPERPESCSRHALTTRKS